MKIDTIIFDIGKVLVDPIFETFARNMTENEEEFQFVMRRIFQGPVWHQMDLGVMDNESELKALIALAPEREELTRKIYNNLGKVIRIYEGSMEWVRDLKEKGYHVYALSDWPRKIYEQREHNMDFLEEMDGYFMSFQIHKCKPDPAYYLELMETYGIVPERAVFLDDREENILAARKLGMHGIVYRDQAQGKEELAKLGVR